MKAKFVFLIVTVVTLSGCTHFYPRAIPTLGLEQKEGKQCPAGERVYYYRNADAAICLPDVMVSYTHCVTELTVANADSTNTKTTKFEVAEVLDKVKGLNLSDEQKLELTRAFEAGGVIGEARAKAIEACKEITLKVYGGEVAPDLEGAQKLFGQ